MRDIIEELKTLADQNRMRILSLIWEAEDLCGCEVERILDLKQSNTSRQLHRLYSAGLISSYKKAQWSHYQIAGRHSAEDSLVGQIVALARSSDDIYREDIARLQDYRERGFSCQTIHKWVYPKMPQGKGVYMSNKKKKVLFVCIHNSARSQMAETFLNDLAGDRFEAESAGLEPGTLNPLVVQVMSEEGYNISGNSTNSVFEFHKEKRSYDIVVAVCSKEAEERCPIFPGSGARLHWPFDDPSSTQGSQEERLQATRRIRDQIRAKIEEFIAEN